MNEKQIRDLLKESIENSLNDFYHERIVPLEKQIIKLGGITKKAPNVIEFKFRMFNPINAFKDTSNHFWDTSSVNYMQSMFKDTSFNQDIGNWNVSSLTYSDNMFENNTSFNQNIGSWNVSRVIDMGFMFKDASAFNQDLTSWCVTNISSEPSDFTNQNSALTSSNKPVWGTCPSD